MNPRPHWSLQYSFAYLTSPEAIHPTDDVQRMTASVMYNHRLRGGNWATTLIWGRNRDLGSSQVFNSYLAESTVLFGVRNYFWGRVGNVDRTSELLLGNVTENSGDRFLARVQACTVGYDRDIDLVPHLATALGAQVTFYGKPEFLTPIYGDHPLGVVLFLRVRSFGPER